MATYAQITSIVASPVSQIEGGLVNIQITIKNIHSAQITVMAHGSLDLGVIPMESFECYPSTYTLNPGGTVTFGGGFYMPNKKVTVHGYSLWYGADQAFHYDDDKSVVVNLTSVATFSNLSVAYSKL